MYLASDWKDYEIIDAGGGNKHERWADVTLLRPDPQAVWPMKEPRSVHARYIRSSAGGGHWEYGRALPESWKYAIGTLPLSSAPPASSIPAFSRNRR